MKRTIKIFVAAGLAFTSLFTLTSCMDILQILLEESGSSSSSYNVVTATKEVEWTYDSSRPVKMIDDTVNRLTIKNVPEGKHLYLVLANPNEYAIKKDDLRVPSGIYTARSAASGSESIEAELPVPGKSQFKYFHGEEIPFPSNSDAASSRTAVSIDSVPQPVMAISGSAGDKKDIYVDNDIEIKNFVQKSATLYATGTYCYVWIVDDYYDKTASGEKVNKTVAEKFRDKFDAMYPYITSVFGTESDELINYDARGNSENVFLDMDSYSDTGKKINIVIYDIGNDYNSSTECGVLGYFYSKDYYYSAQNRSDLVGKSNHGKYFYVDSVYANKSIDTLISTLAHEFQHMINFNQKNIKNLKTAIRNNLNEYEVPDTNFNEMLSMLCEDMMQDYLGLNDEHSPLNRIQSFNIYYLYSGIREYLEKNSALSYSTAYAFGSWLVRQYGGAKLINAISTSSYVDNEALYKAVNSVNGTNKTFDDLFEEFLLAVTGLSSSNNSTYTHNQPASKNFSYSSYYYPMKAFNLWSKTSPDGSAPFSWADTKAAYDMQKTAYEYYNFYGPYILGESDKGGYYVPSVLRPYWGIAIIGVEKTEASSSKTINFSSSGAEGLRLYIIIQ